VERLGLLPWVIIFTVLCTIGVYLPMVGVNAVDRCLYDQLDSPEPPADILFIGSSPIASAVDPAFVSRELTKKLERDIRVERIFLPRAGVLKFAITLDAYLKRRGAPKIVIMHLSYQWRNNLIDEMKWREQYRKGNLKLYSASELNQYNQIFLEGFTGNKIKRVLMANWKSSVELILFKATDYIYRVLSWIPEHYLEDNSCNSLSFTAVPKKHPYGVIDHDVNYEKLGILKKMNKKIKKNAKKRAKESYPVKIEKQYRPEDYHQLNHIAGMLSTEVEHFILTSAPYYSWNNIAPNAKKHIESAVPGAVYIDSYKMFNQPELTGYNKHAFRNFNHVNLNGAHLFSNYWVSELERLLQ
jgi:hypothetical protein